MYLGVNKHQSKLNITYAYSLLHVLIVYHRHNNIEGGFTILKNLAYFW